MAVFNTDVALTQGSGNTNVTDHGLAGAVHILQSVVVVPNTLALNDTINVGYVPRGATVRDVWISSGGIDTNNIAVIQLGDAGSANRLMTASGALLGTGGESFTRAVGGYKYQYPAQTMIVATVSTAGTAKVQQSLMFTIEYTTDGLPS